MSVANELLVDGFDRVREGVHGVLDGLDGEQLAARLDSGANPVGWLVWHLSRVQDDHVAGVAGTEQSWTAQGWERRCGLPFETGDIGFGHSADHVARFGEAGVPGSVLADYHDAVHAETVRYLRGLDDADYPGVIDDRWDPPVTLGVRLMSVLGDTTQHLGQAAYVRGVLLRR